VKPTVFFAPLDFAVLAAFIAGILALGFSAKLRSNSMLQFLVAGRALTLPVFVASLVSLWYGGILGIGESVGSYGIGTWVLFGVPYYVFAIIYALFLSKRVRSAEQLSIPERLELRYGKGVALAGAGLIFLLAVPAAHVLMIGTLLQCFTGWGLGYCVLAGTAIGVSFLYKGGLLADARVSLLAFVMMYVGFIVMVVWCLVHHPLIATLNSIPDKQKLTWDGGTGPIYVLSLFILGAWTLIDPGFHQRVASSASPRVGRTGVLISTGFWFLFDLLSITTAMYAIALNPKAEGLQVFPSFAQAILPPGLKALFFCGILGTIISAMVGYSLVSGATIGREIIARIRPTLSDQNVTLWTRVGITLACAISIGLALSIQSVVTLWTAWAGAVVGAMLIPVCLSYRSRTSPNPAMLISMIAGFAVAIVWMWYGMATGNTYLEMVFMRTQTGFHIVMPNSNASQAAQDALKAGTRLQIGTLLPGLMTSAVVIALGTVFSRKGRQDA
jgi:SSS family solute:Na+ symporter